VADIDGIALHVLVDELIDAHAALMKAQDRYDRARLEISRYAQGVDALGRQLKELVGPVPAKGPSEEKP